MKSGIIYTVITAVGFATLEPVSKLITGTVSAYAITFWRFFIGIFILMPSAIKTMKRDAFRLTAKSITIDAFLGILFVCISMISLQLAVGYSKNPALVAIMFSENSVFTILFAALILKERLNKNKLTAIILGLAAILLCTNYKSGISTVSLELACFSAASFSLYTVLSKKYMDGSGSAQIFFVFIFGSIFLLAALLIGGFPIIPDINLKNVLLMLYLGIVVTGIGYACYFKAIEKGGVILGSLAFFIKPVLTPFISFFVNGAIPTASVYAAAVCVILASYFSVRKKNIKNNT